MPIQNIHPYIYSTKASICIVANDFEQTQDLETTLIKVKNPYESFSKLLEYYNQIKLDKSGIEKPSHISETAKIGKMLISAAFAYIGNNVKLGDNVKIYPNVLYWR